MLAVPPSTDTQANGTGTLSVPITFRIVVCASELAGMRAPNASVKARVLMPSLPCTLPPGLETAIHFSSAQRNASLVADHERQQQRAVMPVSTMIHELSSRAAEHELSAAPFSAGDRLVHQDIQQQRILATRASSRQRRQRDRHAPRESVTGPPP